MPGTVWGALQVYIGSYKPIKDIFTHWKWGQVEWVSPASEISPENQKQ